MTVAGNRSPRILAKRLILSVLGLVPLVSACGSDANPTEANRQSATILGVGDSILEWYRAEGASIVDVVGQSLDRPIYNLAVGGARFSHPDQDAAAEGFDIRAQYDKADRTDFEWVIVNGGANDVLGRCDCDECGQTLDDLVSTDGTSGDMVDFATEVAAGGTKVMFVGYYRMPSGAAFGYDDCQDELSEHGRRLALMADSIDGVFFVSAAEAISPDDLSSYAEDRVHPSMSGSRSIGERVAEAIAEAES